MQGTFSKYFQDWIPLVCKLRVAIVEEPVSLTHDIILDIIRDFRKDLLLVDDWSSQDDPVGCGKVSNAGQAVPKQEDTGEDPEAVANGENPCSELISVADDDLAGLSDDPFTLPDKSAAPAVSKADADKTNLESAHGEAKNSGSPRCSRKRKLAALGLDLEDEQGAALAVGGCGVRRSGSRRSKKQKSQEAS